VIRAEQRRIERLLSLAMLWTAACSTSTAIGPDDGAMHSETADDATLDAIDEDGGGCSIRTIMFDAGNLDGDPGCLYTFNCGVPDGAVVVGCELYSPGNGPLDARVLNCHVVEGQGCADGSYVGTDAGAVVRCQDCFGGVGRGTSTVRRRTVRARTMSGAFYARAAHDEAASAHAFLRLKNELSHHGAPTELVHAALSAARDELRHAKIMARRARKHGAEPPAPCVRRSRMRTLESIARENAIEGCLRETLGAMILFCQAQNDRELMSIACDESRHAALAWAIARWISPKLTPSARDRIRRRAANARIAPTPIDHGAPSVAVQTKMHHAVAAELQSI